MTLILNLKTLKLKARQTPDGAFLSPHPLRFVRMKFDIKDAFKKLYWIILCSRELDEIEKTFLLF